MIEERRNFFQTSELYRSNSNRFLRKERLGICSCGGKYVPRKPLTFRGRVRIIAQVLQYRSLSRQVETLLLSTFFVLGDSDFVLVHCCEVV